MANIAYEVVAEFVFNETAAVLAANKITGAIDGLAKKADQAMFGAIRLGKAYAMSFISGGGGILGLIGSAVTASQKFRSTQIEMANTIVQNGFKINGEMASFNDALLISDKIMGDIIKKGNRFVISPTALAESTKLFAAVLSPKGLAGPNLENAIELSRVAIKGTPALGIDQNQAQTGIFSALAGQLQKGSGFERILLEAGDTIKSVSNGAITDVKSFNKASAKLRLKALIAGLDKLAGSSEAVNARGSLLINKLMFIKEQFIGVGSVLKPLGDTFSKILGPLLDKISEIISTKLRFAVQIVDKTVQAMTGNAEELFITASKIAGASKDIEKARAATNFTLIATSLFAFVKGIGFARIAAFASTVGAKIGPIFSTMFASIATGMRFLMANGGSKVITVALGAAGRAVGVFASYLVIFQILSEAAAKMKINIMKVIDEISGPFLKQVSRFVEIIKMMTEPFDFVVDFFSSLIADSSIIYSALRAVPEAFKMINDALLNLAVTIQGVFIFLKSMGAFIGALFGTLSNAFSDPSNLISGNFYKQLYGNSTEAFSNEMNKGVNGVAGRILTSQESGGKVANNNMTVKIDNTFNIREQIEPDRIAFTMQDQLEKLSRNRRSAVSKPLLGNRGL